jgi:glycosyltransferase involved in cell wall biosynthesis
MRCQKKVEMEREPLISVVVVAERAQDTIGETLASIFEANYGNKEVIVVVNDPDDPSVGVARGFPVKIYNSQEDGLRLFGESGRGFGYQMDLGWRVSKGEFIAYCDSDKPIEREWFNKMLKPFHNPRVGGAGNVEQTKGKSIIAKPKTGYAWVRYYGSTLITKFPWLRFAFRVTVWRREALEDVKGFDRSDPSASGTVEDVDISYRAISRGWALSMSNALSYHYENLGLRDKINRWRREGKRYSALFHHQNSLRPNPVPALYLLVAGIVLTPLILWRTRSLVSLLWPFYLTTARLFHLLGYLSAAPK